MIHGLISYQTRASSGSLIKEWTIIDRLEEFYGIEIDAWKPGSIAELGYKAEVCGH